MYCNILRLCTLLPTRVPAECFPISRFSSRRPFSSLACTFWLPAPDSINVNNFFKNKMDKINQVKVTLDTLKNLVDELEVNDKKDNYLGELPYKVIHLNNNPIDREIKIKESEFENLKKENERLRARLELLESGNDADVTRRIDDAVNNAHQIEILSQKVVELKNREEKILSSFRKTSREFREVCYLLTGYRVDALKDNRYRLSHMYAEREEDQLFFEVSRDGNVQLLENQYTERIPELISTYLENGDSFPAFLASITLDLFKSNTQSIDMSMTLSTTIQPNPKFHSRG